MKRMEQEKKVKQTEKIVRKKNPWKISFLILLGLILGSLVFVFTRISEEREPNYQPSQTVIKGDPTFQVSLKKAQINQIIDYYLNEYQKKSGIKYKFYLEDQALLQGNFKILGHKMKFYLYFDPYVMENGDVQLKAKSLSIGTLELPISQIMSYVQNSYQLPKWVEVNTKSKTILLNLNKFKLENGMRVTAEKINLIDDDIRLNVYLPIDK